MTKRKIGLPRASNMKKAYKSIIENTLSGSLYAVEKRLSAELAIPKRELAFRYEKRDERMPILSSPRCSS
jgi:hypothetical protein